MTLDSATVTREQPRTLPGVYLDEVFPAPTPSFRTGVPAFVVASGLARPHRLAVGDPSPLLAGSLLQGVVDGFFANGGRLCYLAPVEYARPAREGWTLSLEGLTVALADIDGLDDVDLVCSPDLVTTWRELGIAAVAEAQREILRHCARHGDRFAILDGVHSDPDSVLAQRGELTGADAGYGALYYPWLSLPSGQVPPSGHIAGVYARCDRQVGVHKAPANEVIADVVGPERLLTETEMDNLYRQQVNSVRATPSQGVRVWGARTLSSHQSWSDVSTRRTVGTLARWLQQFLGEVTYEPNDQRLWLRIIREVAAFLDGQFARGALAGRTSSEAFFVTCDATTNPRASVKAGQVVAHIGIALNRPAEFIMLRVLHGAGGTHVDEF